MTMRVNFSSLLITLIIGVALVIFRLLGAIWIQNGVLEDVTTFSHIHLGGSNRLTSSLAHVADPDEYKRRSAKALSSSETTIRTTTELVDFVHGNIRQLVIMLLGFNIALVSACLLLYAKLRSRDKRDGK